MFGRKILVILCSIGLSFPLLAQPNQQAYGFNLMTPDEAKCQNIKVLKPLLPKACQWHEGNGYTGDVVSYACEVEQFKHFIFFKDKTECEDQLGTMLANAP
ncbi:hypothetical protein [Vibrio sp. LaRot3]|uniref:hypothetical protein n=1 Tax=Vibrio sp. LaRot3 TaxID=2998829 RepID=UPI0022CE0212|nr:hypothetical protein [Vibrio sp. LaRot3]MDA0147106.1 hypothetical protein [Vibrio sp. LaRot3]